MGGDVSKCCNAKEVRDSQTELNDPNKDTKDVLRKEEVVKAVKPPQARPAITDGKMEWEIKLEKKSDTRLGVNVDVTEGNCLIVDVVREGSLMEWNKEHPELAAKQG